MRLGCRGSLLTANHGRTQKPQKPVAMVLLAWSGQAVEWIAPIRPSDGFMLSTFTAVFNTPELRYPVSPLSTV
jgi:hypothetical protein